MKKAPPPRYKKFKRYWERGIDPGELESLLLDEDPPSLEADHVASRRHDAELVAPVSPKGHKRVERNRRAAGVSRKHQSNPVKRTIQRLRSSAVFKELEAEAMARWADELEASLEPLGGKKRC